MSSLPNRDQLYGRKWRKARHAYLMRNLWCVMCERAGHKTRATVVNHKTKHEGDPVLFWDVDNWESLCTPHHDSTQQRFEKSGRMSGVDADGRPTDPAHAWNSTR